MNDNFVLDCSVAMTWLFAEQATAYTIAIQNSLLKTKAWVPAIWPLEIKNVLWSTMRIKKITELQAKRFLYLLKNLPIEVDLRACDLTNDIILDLAQTYHLTCYDAAYLELCIREHLPMVTLDKALEKAAKKAGCPLLKI